MGLQWHIQYFITCLSLHFQKKATDPTRFANRGGNLLKEEKQRSELHKSLPKVKRCRAHMQKLMPKCLPFNNSGNHKLFCVLLAQLEKKLTAEIEAWESEQGQEFLVSGQKFMQYVAEQWEMHRVDKELEKRDRVNKAIFMWTCLQDGWGEGEMHVDAASRTVSCNANSN